jgi:hypothetical protein
MIKEFFIRLLPPHLQPQKYSKKKEQGKKGISLLSKRQKFVISVGILSVGLFLSEYFFSGYVVAAALFLGFLTDILLFWALYEDMEGNFSLLPFILPFLCSLSFGLFYFLAPSRLLTRVVLTSLYAVGLYSVYLSENIFVVASIRTIALLSSARIVTFVISLISFFFLSNTIFSFRLAALPTVGLFALFTLLFSLQAVWTYTLETSLRKDILWSGVVTLVLSEIVAVLWFWPTLPTVFAIFMTAMYYIFIGLIHVWLDKRLFKNVLWEYMWVAIVAVFILIWFSSWQ